MGLVVLEDLQAAGIAESTPDLPLDAAHMVGQMVQESAADGFGSFRVQSHPDLPGELLHRVFIVGDTVDVGQRNATLLETESESPPGQARIVFGPGESLLLRRGDQLAVA